jgi:hypothetical protein
MWFTQLKEMYWRWNSSSERNIKIEPVLISKIQILKLQKHTVPSTHVSVQMIKNRIPDCKVFDEIL